MSAQQSSVHTDQATVHDRLSFKPYRDTLVEVIRQAETPLTVGIFGAWGSGKTSLLLMLRDALQKRKSKPRARVVWFNAWQYGQEAALWRALLSRVLEALRPGEPAEGEEEDDETAALNAELDDLQASLYRDVDREETGGLEVDWGQLAKGGLKGALKFGLSYIPGVRLLEDLVSAAKKETKEWTADVLDAFRRERTRIHLDHVRFLEQFRDRFENLVKTRVVKNGERLVVFVDDLDRCLPEKAIEVLEAIKLFLDVKGCVFVIAVDRDVIVKGIRVKYRDFALRQDDGELPISGGDYLEKIIQVPFYLPPVSREGMVEFIRTEVRGLPAGCADVFSLGIETNPRKIKRTLNVFWMHNRLAQKRKELKGVIQPVRLSKVVVIQNRYPELYRDWVEAPLLLRHLEERFIEERRREHAEGAVVEPEEPAEMERAGSGTRRPGETPPLPPTLDSESVRRWANRRPLRRMLLYRAGKPGMGFAGMEQKDLEAYIYLTSTAAAAAVSEEQLDERIWEDLLSGDPTRAQSAVGHVTSEKEQSAYARRLLSVVAPGSKHPALARASAGTAMGLFGDPRFRSDAWHLPDEALLGFIKIPEGEFSMGSTLEQDPEANSDEQPQHRVTLPDYYIARYPVTVAQFRAFVEGSGRELDPSSAALEDVVANHPVVNVTWHDARAYCDWLSERLSGWDRTPEPLAQLLATGWRITLPSEAEWEKAARGVDGRIFPWGGVADPDRANYDETGIGGISAVGCFPAGASPYGVLDLSGDVWEWTRSHFEDYPYEAKDGREALNAGEDVARVLRGGAFDCDRLYVRCACRASSSPNGWNDFIGFRVVASPS